MDPLVQIEWIAGVSAVVAACGAGLIAFGGSVLLAMINAHVAAAKELRDYTRQDEVARRLEASNERVVDTTAETFRKLDHISETAAVIHTLVNSDLTKSIQGELDATISLVAMAEKMGANDRGKPSSEMLGIIEAGKAKIASLRGDLAQRAKQQTIVDRQPPALEA